MGRKPTRRPHLPITGSMWTRRTSCHEPSNRNRDAAWKVIFVLFHEKSHLTPNLTPRFPSAHVGRYQDGTPPSTAILRPSTCCADFALDAQGQIPYIPSRWKQGLIASPPVASPTNLIFSLFSGNLIEEIQPQCLQVSFATFQLAARSCRTCQTERRYLATRESGHSE